MKTSNQYDGEALYFAFTLTWEETRSGSTRETFDCRAFVDNESDSPDETRDLLVKLVKDYFATNLDDPKGGFTHRFYLLALSARGSTMASANERFDVHYKTPKEFDALLTLIIQRFKNLNTRNGFITQKRLERLENVSA